MMHYMTVLSCWQHILDWDNRNDPDLPTNGYRIKMTHELAGLGGDVHFSKGEMMSEHLLELYRNWVSLSYGCSGISEKDKPLRAEGMHKDNCINVFTSERE